MLLNTKFLLVDDDTDDADLFCEALTSFAPSMRCYTAWNGKLALEMLSDGRIEVPDVIFLDINMPIMNGWECLKKLKSNAAYQNIPTIMYSTSSAPRDIELAYSLGVTLFLSKPENFKDLCQILEVVATSPQESLPVNLTRFGSLRANPAS